MRRLTLALAAALTLSSVPLVAAAAGPDLRPELPPPAGSGWQEAAAGTRGDGPMTLEDVASTNRSPDHARSVLQTASFQAGYRRVWTEAAGAEVLTERDYLFGNAFGAGLWLGTIKAGDERAADWRQTYDLSSIPNSFGGYRFANGSYDTVIEFAPGDRVYAVSITSPSGPEQQLALEQAQQMRATAPVEVFSSGGAVDLERIGLITLGVLLALALVVVLVILLALRSSRRGAAAAAPPAQGPMYSPDGRWYWDGRQWQPTGPPPPR